LIDDLFGLFVYDYNNSDCWEYYDASYVADELDDNQREDLMEYMDKNSANSYVIIADVYAEWEDYSESGLAAAKAPTGDSFFDDLNISEFYFVDEEQWYNAELGSFQVIK